MTFATDPVGGTLTEMSFFDPGGDIGDLAFAVAAFQLECYDAELEGSVGQIRITAELKKAYRDRIQEIKEWLSNADADSETILIPADSAAKAQYAWSSEENVVVDRGEKNIFGDDATFRLVDEEGNTVQKHVEILVPDSPLGPLKKIEYDLSIEGNESLVRSEAPNFPNASVMVEVKKEALDNEVSRLEGELDDLSADGEIQLLAINRALSRRNQALQLASNILSSTHQSAMGIIQNIK